METRRKVLCMDKLSEKMKRLSRQYLADNIEIVFCDQLADCEKNIATSDVLVTFTQGISKEWIEKAAQCIFIQKLGAGVNNIDISAASKRNIPVANTQGLNARAVAEHTIMLMLAVYKHLVAAHNQIVHEGKWLKTELRDYSYQLSYKKVGLIGFGNIGREVLKVLKGFQCEVSYYDLFRLSTEEEERLNVKYVDLDSLIRDSDILSLHVPLNEKTYHLLNEARLKMMKKTAVLINTCRGGVIDEEALFEVLQSGHLLGAGLDVFEKEPISRDHKLTKWPNVILTPHIGGGTNEAMESVLQKAFENINHMLVEGKLPNEKDIVNMKDLKLLMNE